MKKAPYILFLLIIVACQEKRKPETANSPSSEILEGLFQSITEFESSAQDSLFRGKHPIGQWKSSSHEQQKIDYDSISEYINSLENVSDSELTGQEVISKKVMLIKLRNQLAAFKHNMHLIPINAEGGFYNNIAYVLPNLSFTTTKDYLDYISWLPEYNKYLHENIELMQRGISKGVVAPKIIVQNTLNLLKPWAVSDWKGSAFYEPLSKLPDTIDETDRSDIIAKSETEIKAILATYQELQELFGNEYMNKAKNEPGISFIPNGKSYYENRVKHFTTLELSPDSVHNLGLSEVARIKNAMQKIIDELEFEGSFAEFLDFLRTDERFYAKTPQELLNYASWLSKKAEGQLPKLFNELYSLPFTVEPVPMSIAPTYTTGRYVGGSWETMRAGIYWVNTYNLPSRTLYTMPSLTLHEAVPGHHLQNAIAAEIEDIPEFRNNYYISAFGEGWGLYSEYLGEEMGMYETPYELFGRYTYEMWRACRLVVDTGIHYKGWTRERALDYMAGNTALSIHEVTTEIDRYIGWPGQALSYKVGEIKIKALRSKAEEGLGDDFDIREFHHTILKNGSIPLDILEEQVNAYLTK